MCDKCSVVCNEQVVLEGMPGFEDFYEDSIDDEDAISWVDDDLSINWEGMQDELFGEDFTDIGNGDGNNQDTQKEHGIALLINQLTSGMIMGFVLVVDKPDEGALLH